MDVSIIIVNYNTKHTTAACIDSVFNKTRDISFEVILVDNASTDGSKECFEQDERINYIFSTENLGFGRANNVGISHAKGRNIIFLNPDTLLINNAIAILSVFLDAHRNVGAVGGNLYTPQEEPNFSYNHSFPSIIGEIDQAMGYAMSRIIYGTPIYFNKTEQPIAVSFVSGANMMVSRDVLDELGGFDEDFFMYYEETELSWRIKHKGYCIVNVPQAKIIHLEGASFDNNERRFRMSMESRTKYYQKTRGALYARMANRIYSLLNSVAIIVYSITRKQSRAAIFQMRRKVIKTLNK